MRGWGEARHLPSSAGLVLAALVLLAAAVPVVRRWSEVHAHASAFAIGNAALLLSLLLGQLSEVHYLLIVFATVAAGLAARPDRRTAVAALPGLVLLAMPATYVELVARGGTSRQNYYVLAELLLLAAVVFDLTARAPSAPRRRPAGPCRSRSPGLRP